MEEIRLTPCLTPHGRLLVTTSVDALGLEASMAKRIEQSFARGPGHGLLKLGAAEVGHALPATFAYWREFAGRYVRVARR